MESKNIIKEVKETTTEVENINKEIKEVKNSLNNKLSYKHFIGDRL